MITIYKYEFTPQDHPFTIAMHKNARLLTVQIQRTKTCLWAIVDTQQPIEDREFVTLGTGNEIDPKLFYNLGDYVGTFQMISGFLIGHLFAVLPPPAEPTPIE